MRFYNVEMKGKFKLEKQTSLPVYNPDDEGRMMYYDGGIYYSDATSQTQILTGGAGTVACADCAACATDAVNLDGQPGAYYNCVDNATGTLPILNGGSGATTAANARTNFGVPGLCTVNTFCESQCTLISSGTYAIRGDGGTNGIGVAGIGVNQIGVTGYSEGSYGVFGGTGLGGPAGVMGCGTGASTYGVYGENGSGPGVFGCSGTNYGVLGCSASTSGIAIYGSASGATAVGVYGINNTGFGVSGQTDSGTGVYGCATTGYAGRFTATGGDGVNSYSQFSYAVCGCSLACYGVFGCSVTGGTYAGVRGESNDGRGVYGYSVDCYGVYACATGTGAVGLYARSPLGTGICGVSSLGVGVCGYTDAALPGVCGFSGGAFGVSSNAGYTTTSSKNLKHLQAVCLTNCLKETPLTVYKYYWEDSNNRGFNEAIGPTAEDFNKTFNVNHAINGDEYQGLWTVDGAALGLGIENLKEMDKVKDIIVKMYSCIQKLETEVASLKQ